MAGKFWTQAWSVVTGCEPISAGCANCWAVRELRNKPVLAEMHTRGRFLAGHRDSPARFHPELLDRPDRWARPRRIAVGWLGDLWQEDVPGFFIDQVIDVARVQSRHRFLFLTKRDDSAVNHLERFLSWMWFGVTAENEDATARLRMLDTIPRAVGGPRWAICEPLLGPINLLPYLGALDWVVVGAETGPGARACRAEWVQDIVCQCGAAGVPVWVKAAPPRPYIGGVAAPWPREMPEGLRLSGEEW